MPPVSPAPGWGLWKMLVLCFSIVIVGAAIPAGLLGEILASLRSRHHCRSISIYNTEHKKLYLRYINSPQTDTLKKDK